MQIKLKHGFTLIELVVVMAIIAVLAALMVAALSAARKQARNTQRTGQIKTIEIALEGYAARNGGKYPLIQGTGAYLPQALVDALQTTWYGGPYLSQSITLDTFTFVYAHNAPADPLNINYQPKATGYTLGACNADGPATAETSPTVTTPADSSINGCKTGFVYVAAR